MSKIAIVYWSGTGNTKMMAEAIRDGAAAEGADVSVYEAGNFDTGSVDNYDAVAFGCPAMGAEELEEGEFEPMFSACNIKERKIALFGSYGWGDGEWMRTWEERAVGEGAVIVSESVICNDAPDDEAVEKCIALGKEMAKK